MLAGAMIVVVWNIVLPHPTWVWMGGAALDGLISRGNVPSGTGLKSLQKAAVMPRKGVSRSWQQSAH